MAENKLITTKTEVTVIGSNISVRTYYDDALETLVFFLSDATQIVQGVDFESGDLGYIYENTSSSFSLTSDGNLFVSDPTNVTQYSIDSDGNLIQTT